MYWPDYYDISLDDFEGDFLDEELEQYSCTDPSPRSRLTASFLVILLGATGVHRFYLGKTDTALSMLVLAVPSSLALWYPLGWLFMTVLVAWVMVDGFIVLTGRMQDSEGMLVKNWR